jgi:hypothetical protein
MSDTDRIPVPSQAGPSQASPSQANTAQTTALQAGAVQAGALHTGTGEAGAAGRLADGQLADHRAPIPCVDQAIKLREHAPEMYDLWLKIAQEKAATANYVDRAPYEVPERLAQTGRPRALGALVIVLSFCGYLAWLGGPGPYIAGVIAILDLAIMFGMFFGLRPERLPDAQPTDRRPRL